MFTRNGQRQSNRAYWITNAPTRFITLADQRATLSAANDTMTTPNAHGLSVGDQFLLAPLQTTGGLAVPTLGGLTSGIVYVVQAVVDAKNVKLATLAAPTTLIDITADGTCGFFSKNYNALNTPGVIEAFTANSNGLTRQAFAGTDLTDPGLTTTTDHTLTLAKRTFKPTGTYSFIFTHVLYVDADSATAGILSFVPAGSFQQTTAPSGQYDTVGSETQT